MLLFLALGLSVALRKESVDRNARPTTRKPIQYVALRKESVDRNIIVSAVLSMYSWSLSARRAWIEMADDAHFITVCDCVALRKESVDRNKRPVTRIKVCIESLSARRAWIEILRGCFFA